MSDPYGQMARAFTKMDNSGSFRFGTITGVSPLTVNISGLSISGEALFINQNLIPQPQKAEISLPGSQISESEGSITFSEPLKTGDRVFIYSDNDQIFYIICKVVSA